MKDIADFEKELGIKFNELIKGDPQSIEENNGLLWAKKIFKTKPNRNISDTLRQKVHTVFNHLTKEELIDKVLANYFMNTKTTPPKETLTKKHKKH